VDGSSSMQNPVHPVERFTGLYTGPYFDSTTATNITTQLGTHAYLPCKVKQLGNKSVSTKALFIIYITIVPHGLTKTIFNAKHAKK